MLPIFLSSHIFSKHIFPVCYQQCCSLRSVLHIALIFLYDCDNERLLTGEILPDGVSSDQFVVAVFPTIGVFSYSIRHTVSPIWKFIKETLIASIKLTYTKCTICRHMFPLWRMHDWTNTAADIEYYLATTHFLVL